MLNHNRFAKELDLLLTMIDGEGHTSTELCEVLGTTRRNFYYYLDFLREYGFNVIKEGTRYRLDPSSGFFRSIANNVSFSDDEAGYIYKLIEAVQQRNVHTETVRNKLRRFYDIRLFTDKQLRNRLLQNISLLHDAMQRKRVVILKDYSSPHSHTVSDRLVEPFLLLNDGSDVRCYELSSRMNKTFKLSRVGEVRIVEDVMWSHEYMHKKVFTDLFLFSGEDRYHVTLRLGQLAHNVLLEEYPQSASCVTPEDDDHWRFETDVVSYAGIGRFILGLAEDIEVLGDEGLKKYLAEKVARMSKRFPSISRPKP